MAKTKVELQNYQGESLSPITIASNVLYEDGRNAQEVFEEYSNETFTPTIENSGSMFKVGQGDNVDYSSNVVNGAYESMVLKGKTMVNCIQEPSSQDVVLPYEFAEGQYVTINDTKESGALGVELKGRTLVNLSHTKDEVSSSVSAATTIENITNVKPNTDYICFVNIKSSNPLSGITINQIFRVEMGVVLGGVVGDISTNYTTKYFIFNTGDRTSVNVVIRNAFTDASIGLTANTVHVKDVMILEYQQGMENWDIPYFEGMTSCKMPILRTVGKNLFNINGYSTKNQYVSINGNTITVNAPTTFSNTVYTLTGLKEDELYRVSLDKIGLGEFSIRDKNNSSALVYVENEEGHVSRTFTYKKGATLRIGNRQIVNSELSFANIQIEHGSTETTYEPYKSSILSLPEEVVLRSLPNGVCDTFNTRTGVYTQRIGEYVFQDTENATYNRSPISDNKTETSAFRHNDVPTFLNMKTCSTLYCDKFPTIDGKAGNGVNDFEYVKTETTNPFVWFNVKKSKLPSDTIAGFKQWLSQNPITVQYKLNTPIITKINLSSTLKSWNTTTHIYSEIPENTLYPILSHSNPTYPVILKPSTKYSIVANSYSNGHTNSAINFNLGGATASTTVGSRVTTITTPSTLSNELLTMSGRGNKLNNVMVIEGDVVGDEPYFEGICDCKSPILSNVGKNLFDERKVILNKYQNHNTSNGEFSISTNTNYKITDFIRVKPNTRYDNQIGNGAYYNINKKPLTNHSCGINIVTTPSDAHYVVLNMGINEDTSTGYFIEAPQRVTHEPYKSNTTTFNQKDSKTIVLRSLPNGVCDTLNLTTGEYIQRIGEVVLDGSGDEQWSALTPVYFDNLLRWKIGLPRQSTVSVYRETSMVCDRVKVVNYAFFGDRNYEFVSIHENGVDLQLMLEKNKAATVAELKEYLQQHPTIVQYELATPIVSTIDVQGFPYAYTNGHVQLSSGHSGQSLTPKVEYSVATNRNGQIRSNQKMVERHQKQLDQLQAIILANMVNTQYQQTLTALNYDLLKKEVGE